MKSFLFLSFFLASNLLFAKDAPLKIYAAASLSNALSEIANVYHVSKFVFNFDASSRLARQIESGAPADLYFSADTEWMDYLAQKDKILKATRVELVSNKMVLIVAGDSTRTPELPKDLNDEFYKHIALAGESVPAGKFARAALKSEGVLTESFAKRIVSADNVRVALSWVAAHEAEAGAVYATDALVEPKVKVAFAFKEGTYPKIIYPAAVVSSSTQSKAAEKFLKFCQSKKAQEIFTRAGFDIL